MGNRKGNSNFTKSKWVLSLVLLLSVFFSISFTASASSVPQTTSVNLPANKTYSLGQTLDLTVNFSEDVYVTGIPIVQINLNTGGTVNAIYFNGSGTSALTFRYTVNQGELDSDGINILTTINLNGGSVDGLGGTPSNTLLNGIGNSTFVKVDGINPTVTSVTAPSNGTYTAGQNVDFSVNFSESVFVSGTPSFPVTLNDGGIVNATYVSGTGSSSLLFRYPVARGTADLDGITVGASVALNSGTIKDAVTNDAITTLNNVGNTTLVKVDGKTHVTVTGIVANNRTYNALTSATLDLSGYSLAGKVTGEDVSLDTSATITGTFAGKTVGTGKAVTITGLALVGSDVNLYTLDGYAPVSANITTKAINVTAGSITVANKIYDQTSTAVITSTSATLTGVESGDIVTLNRGSIGGSFPDKNVATGKTIAISGLSLGGADAGNYTLNAYSTTADITPYKLTVNGITASNKTYNANTVAEVNTTFATLSNALRGETVTLNTSSKSGAFSNKNVGTAKVVTIGGLTLDGAYASNYALNAYTTTANIYKATLHVLSPVANNKTYNATTTTTVDMSQASLLGVLGGDVVGIDTVNSVGTFNNKNVGTSKPVSIQTALTGIDGGNYQVAVYNFATADITPKTISATGITVSNKVYNGNTSATLNVASGALSGVILGDVASVDTSAAVGTFADKNVGNAKVITVTGLTITGSDAANYSLNSYTKSANITKKAISASGITASNKVYNRNTVATLNSDSGALSGVVPGDVVTLNASSAVGTFANKNVANAKTVTVTGLALTGIDASNYSLTAYTTTANITKKAISVISISATNKVYNATTAATLNAASAALSGVENGDSVALNKSAIVGVFNNKNVGTSKVVTISGFALSGADAANYSVNDATTTANITPKSVSASNISVSNKVYDQSTSATLVTNAALLLDVVLNDVVTLDTTAATAAFPNATAGSGKVIPVLGLTLNGADAANYTLAAYSTTATITQRIIYATGITAMNKKYDGNNIASLNFTNAKINDVFGGEVVTLNFAKAKGTFNSLAIGTNKVVGVNNLSLAGADASNYILRPYTTTANITQ